jgi:xylulokinase
MVPGAGHRLPPLRDLTDRVGTIAAGLPFAGVPVFVGVMDAWAGFSGIGVTGERDAGYLSGTSEVLGIVSAAHVPTPGVIVFPERGGIRLHAAPTQSGGASLDWLAQLFGRAPAELADLAGATKPSPAVPVFLPHLEGERAPLWDPRSRGVFARIGAASGAGEIARAVLEGVAFSARLAFEATEMSAGHAAASLNLGGGGARFDGWCQIRADALGKTLRRVKVLDAGTLGAAIIAGLGSGSWTSLAAAAEILVAFERDFEPGPSLRNYYDDRFQNYRRLYEDLKAFNAGYG